MPLADVPRHISRLLEGRGERDFGCGQVGHQRRTGELLVRAVGPAWQPVGNPDAGRVLAGHDRRPRRGAYRGCGISVREPQALGRQSIQVWSLVVLAAVAPEVAPPEVVGHDEDHVGPLGGGEGEPEQSDGGVG